MRFLRVVGCCVGLVVVLVTAGCGGGSGGTTGGGETTAGGGSTAGGAATHTGGQGGAQSPKSSFQSRGIKGENPTTEAATKARLSRSDCAALGRLAERDLGTKLARHSTPAPPLSRCRLSGPGTSIDIFLDTGFAANQRYQNRIVETDQFGYESPAKVPHPVSHVGEKAVDNADANWIPALGSLLAVRGNRWLTVTISVAGRPNRQLRDEAAVLARAGFRLSA